MVARRYPEVEPYDQGMLEVGDGQLVHWELCGDPEVVLIAIATTRRHEVDWITRQMGRLFPEAWARFRDGVPAADRDGRLADAGR